MLTCSPLKENSTLVPFESSLYRKYVPVLECVVSFLLQNIRVYGGDIDEEMEDQFYLQRLDVGLFTLQLLDYVMLEICSSGPSSVRTSTICSCANTSNYVFWIFYIKLCILICKHSGKYYKWLLSCLSDKTKSHADFEYERRISEIYKTCYER